MTTKEVTHPDDPFYRPEVVVSPATPGVKTDDNVDKFSMKTSNTSQTFAGSLSPTVNNMMNKIQETVQGAPGSVFAERGDVFITDEKTGQTRQFSRQELRQQYEDDEVDRFLRVFARQVHEVQMAQELPPDIPKKEPTVPMDATIPAPLKEGYDEDEEEWHIEPETSSMATAFKQAVSSPTATLSAAADAVTERTTAAAQNIKENSQHTYTLLDEGEWHGRSPAEYVAMEWIVPYLPRPHRKTYHFTLGGMQGTVTRLYLACQPLYEPFMARMVALMTWENPRRSFLYCALFWVLWFFDLLLAALFARMCFSLLRRGVLPYPTAEDLAERRTAEARADVVGDTVHSYLDGSLAKGVRLRDAWTMFRIATKNKKIKAKNAVTDSEDTKDKDDRDDDPLREDENMRRAVLAIMEETADFHERFANLCHWRDPSASIRYSVILGVMVVVALFAPYKYVIKGTYAAGGFGFWFVPNLWMALPVEHRSRIPPPLGDVPTDAEYAMSIISQRVDRGQDVLPPERRKKDKKNSSTTNLSSYSISPSNTFSSKNRSSTSIGSNADDKSYLSTGDTRKPRGFTARVATAGLADQHKRKESLDENGEPLPEQTFPAKYHASMGMLSLTPESLLFYPMMSSNAKVVIPLQDIRGVKKAGRMGGLRIKYVVRGDEPQASQSIRKYVEDQKKDTDSITSPVTSAANGEPLEREEKFGWISGRDEIFAKLVGWGGRRWVKM